MVWRWTWPLFHRYFGAQTIYYSVWKIKFAVEKYIFFEQNILELTIGIIYFLCVSLFHCFDQLSDESSAIESVKVHWWNHEKWLIGRIVFLQGFNAMISHFLNDCQFIVTSRARFSFFVSKLMKNVRFLFEYVYLNLKIANKWHFCRKKEIIRIKMDIFVMKTSNLYSNFEQFSFINGQIPLKMANFDSKNQK